MNKSELIYRSVDKLAQETIQFHEPTGEQGSKIYLSPGNLIAFREYIDQKAKRYFIPYGVTQINSQLLCGYWVTPDISIKDDEVIAKKLDGTEIIKGQAY